MPKAKSKTEIGRNNLGLGSAGRAVPEKALRSHLARSQAALKKELSKRSRLENKAARATGKAPPSRTAKERQHIRRQIAAFSKQFAKHAQIIKPIVFEPAGIFSISAKLAPTFAFAHTNSDLTGVGNTLTATRSAGSMGMTFSNQVPDAILRFSLVEMGGFFFPPPGAVRITARANPRIAFSWFINSDGRRIFTDGQASIRIVGFKGANTQGDARGGVQLWRENRDEGTSGFEFDVSPAAEFPVSTQLKTNNSDFYLITVRLFATHGASHPGNPPREAHALGSMSASLPAIDLDVQIVPAIVKA